MKLLHENEWKVNAAWNLLLLYAILLQRISVSMQYFKFYFWIFQTKYFPIKTFHFQQFHFAKLCTHALNENSPKKNIVFTFLCHNTLLELWVIVLLLSIRVFAASKRNCVSKHKLDLPKVKDTSFVPFMFDLKFLLIAQTSTYYLFSLKMEEITQWFFLIISFLSIVWLPWIAGIPTK